MEIRHESRERHRADRAHHAEAQRRTIHHQELSSRRLDCLGAAQDLRHLRTDQPAELGEQHRLAITGKQQPAELIFQLLDGARQRRLRDIAALRGTPEIQRLARAEEVTDFMQFHDVPRQVSYPTRIPVPTGVT